MRTTVTIHDGLLETVKRRAKERGQTLGEVLEEALQDYLARPEPDLSRAPKLPTFRGGGLRQGIDPSSNTSLYEAMHAEEDAEQAERIRR